MLITPAYAQASDPFHDYFIWFQLFSFLWLWGVTLIFGYFIARRKGKGTLAIIVGTFPFWGFFVVIWWASLTDKDVLERLSRLEGGR